ncbi:MAG: 50S ribosomal protein L16 [Candidatus Komeilibacteria bacterium CG_4_10_14_0_2_um_filter_37_10]|uniref:Large ribosomal subunit protein uL16 n=1 Tax=Candidatus Komeilibacteria bacterium CG_4_10_14_0_2_um_filter_37_10 TaxID=1974470 RepID=A0A2M7VED6_9BACT|nr:MAG: 50S ribosomal protein L16 [Candidatus Komeilibacteria bacterium CG_4_10_14_0_2_um_filter_37_10]PJA94391.1 MAG: 50S ribosomal protein L16 [Candidatus Komeilibacteria bacterium CG_4_9_14_3_um_filter_37_5]
MLAPKKVKHRKWHRTDQIKGRATRTTFVAFGDYGLKAISKAQVTARQIESSRRVISRYVQRGGKIWIRVFPDRPVTAKGSEVPMGSGKGAVDHYVVQVKAGTVLFEISGVKEKEAQEAFKLASYKLPVKTKFVTKLDK